MEKLNRFTFKKNERITSRDKIDKLYKSGKSIKAFPLYAKYIIVDNQEVSSQILISVSKRKLRKAVDRNRIKRLIREAYRLNKHNLTNHLEAQNIKIAFVINYSLSELTTFDIIEKQIINILSKIKSETLGNE